MPPWFIPAYFKKTQASKLGDAQGIPFFIDNIIRVLFLQSFQKTEDLTKWGHEAARVAGAARPGRADLPPGPLVWPLALTFRLLKAPVAKPPDREPRYGKPYGDAAAANPISGDSEIASGTLPERGFISRRTLHRHDRLRNMASSINFNQFLEKEKLKSNGSNFTDWFRHLQPDKLEPKAEKCVFIGYPKETIGYTFYHRSEGKIFVAKNGTFLEKEFLTKEVTGRKVELDEIEESLLVDQSSAVPENVPVPPTPATEEANDNDHETSNETATEPRRSTRDRATPDWYDPCLNVMIVDNNDEDPATYEEAMMSPDSNKWQEAMKSEMGSIYQSDPGMEHWTAVKNILKYLKRTKDMFLCYGGDQELVVTSYTDASWNTDPDDSKSQSGYVFILNGAAVSWASSKQCTVAKSSTESEYIAASEASSEAVWMKRFIVELGVVPSALDPFVIYCDNMGAIANAQEPRSHKRLKHIKLRYHSIREYIEDGEVKICKVHTDLNVADPLTKALPRAKHDQHQNAMGVRNHQGRWSPHGTPPPWPANPSGGGVPSGLPLRGPATPPMEGGNPTSSGRE
ncbi:hypothetical protein QYE76_071139, partial [Lolium multiflorum]